MMPIPHQRQFGAVSTAVILLVCSAPASHAQEPYQPIPQIDGLNVEEVARLRPGVELNFGMYGSPGGHASLRITGAARNLTLTEVEPGQYEGVYTIGSRDKITARSPVTANLRLGNQVSSTVLNESLQIGVGTHNRPNFQRHNVASSSNLPKIERFSVTPSNDLSSGNDLQFDLVGSPGGKVELAIAGVPGKVYLQEVRPGEYSNTYTIRNRDRIRSNSVVTANLWLGQQSRSMVLGQALQYATPQNPAPRACRFCGTVEAVNLIQVKGDGNYLGTIGGGLVGVLIGSQIGNGSGRTAAQIAGALGGAYAGREISRNAQANTHYEVVVRLQNGAQQTLSYASDPGFRVGERVNIKRGVLEHLP